MNIEMPLCIDLCITDADGNRVTPSRLVLEGNYPSNEFKTIDIYFGRTLDEWQIEHARSLKAESICYIGDGIWIALRRRQSRP